MSRRRSRNADAILEDILREAGAPVRTIIREGNDEDIAGDGIEGSDSPDIEFTAADLPSPLHDIIYDQLRQEVAVDKRGHPHQVGASSVDGVVVAMMKKQAERSLYFFNKAVIGFKAMTPSLHRPLCLFWQSVPPKRKLILIPRDHFKTSVMKGGVIHVHIQPDGSNIYFPDGIGDLGHSDGRSTRILLSSKTATLSRASLGEVAQIYESNTLLRAFWPEAVWEDPKRQARYWSAEQIQLPRVDIFKEPSIFTIGVGGTVTGFHFNYLLHDDLIDREDANSVLTMLDAIDWFKRSRPLMDGQERSLETTTGTRWAVKDLYQEILDNDRTVTPYIRRAIENGAPIFPERYPMSTLLHLQATDPMFPLLYMNTPTDPSLIDFPPELFRTYRIEGDMIIFEKSPLDDEIARVLNRPVDAPDEAEKGRILDDEMYDAIKARAEYLNPTDGSRSLRLTYR